MTLVTFPKANYKRTKRWRVKMRAHARGGGGEPSTIAAVCPNAMDAMAPAVYGPIPGTLRRSLTAVGGEGQTSRGGQRGQTRGRQRAPVISSNVLRSLHAT
jgi:hypothetical protein